MTYWDPEDDDEVDVLRGTAVLGLARVFLSFSQVTLMYTKMQSPYIQDRKRYISRALILPWSSRNSIHII